VFLTDLETGTPFIHEAKILVSAVGGYVNPKYPSLQGLEEFQGPVAHTAAWPENLDLAGKNVVVVGNGCKSGSSSPPPMSP
jgi:cation diffusion facilitator CzcD-associated flavoprotein CzcO